MNKYYTRLAIDHFLHPRNARELTNADGVGEAVNKAGDTVRFFVRFEADHITEAAFKAQGCAATIAAASVLTELALGRSRTSAPLLSLDDVDAALGGLPRFKLERAAVAVSAVLAALEDAEAS